MNRILIADPDTSSRKALCLLLNKKLGIKNEKRRIVPRLIIRLVLKDLEPGDFINELAAALNMNDQAAKALAQEIEEKIFNPIALGLRQSIGLDIKLIYFGKPSERGPAKLGEMPSQPPQAETPAAPQQFTKPFTAPIMPSAPRMPEPEEPEIGKPLRNVLKGRRRVQIGSFVLIYEIDKNDNKITLFSFEHHDSAYK